jgi:hypothetical protein
MEKKCITCSGKLLGRSDKKYCSDNCRYDHHNQKKRLERTQLTKSVNDSIWHNRKILYQLTCRGITKLKRKELEFLGFNFNTLTGFKIRDRNDYDAYCYEYLLTMKNQVVHISIIQEVGTGS